MEEKPTKIKIKITKSPLPLRTYLPNIRFLWNEIFSPQENLWIWLTMLWIFNINWVHWTRSYSDHVAEFLNLLLPGLCFLFKHSQVIGPDLTEKLCFNITILFSSQDILFRHWNKKPLPSRSLINVSCSFHTILHNNENQINTTLSI